MSGVIVHSTIGNLTESPEVLSCTTINVCFF